MFEEEAKERARKLEESQTLGVYDNDEDYARDSGWNDGEVAGYEEGFTDGAEFGYNRANEWHYVKDGDLPKDDIKLAIIEIDDCGYLLCNYRNGFWCDANSGATCAEWITNNIIAWKEIELPELEEK